MIYIYKIKFIYKLSQMGWTRHSSSAHLFWANDWTCEFFLFVSLLLRACGTFLLELMYTFVGNSLFWGGGNSIYIYIFLKKVFASMNLITGEIVNYYYCLIIHCIVLFCLLLLFFWKENHVPVIFVLSHMP